MSAKGGLSGRDAPERQADVLEGTRQFLGLGCGILLNPSQGERRVGERRDLVLDGVPIGRGLLGHAVGPREARPGEQAVAGELGHRPVAVQLLPAPAGRRREQAPARLDELPDPRDLRGRDLVRRDHQDVVFPEIPVERRPLRRDAMTFEERLQLAAVDEPDARLRLARRGPSHGIQQELSGVGDSAGLFSEIPVVRERDHSPAAEVPRGDHGDFGAGVRLAGHDDDRRWGEDGHRAGRPRRRDRPDAVNQPGPVVVRPSIPGPTVGHGRGQDHRDDPRRSHRARPARATPSVHQSCLGCSFRMLVLAHRRKQSIDRRPCAAHRQPGSHAGRGNR